MRFAPPKSAPPDSGKTSHGLVVSPRESILSGWCSPSNQPDDLTLLTQCAAASPRRCSSATPRNHGQMTVHFGSRRSVTRNHSASELKVCSSKLRALSKDSGVDGLTETASMDRLRFYEEEFSDISDSDSDNETVDNPVNEELMRLTVDSDTEDVTFPSPATHPAPTITDEEVELPRKELRDYFTMMNNSNPHSNKSKGSAKKSIRREHQMPKPVTPDIPESPMPIKTQLWSRSKKLERHSTSPSLCSCTDVIYDKNDDPFLNNTFENVLQANRPPYRNEKRRTNNAFKSSCSIPSFSTPNQALLLIGMQPANKPQDSNKAKTKVIPARKASFPKPPIPRKAALVELPALSVNGAGDLVIRKKQIISG